MWVDMMNLWNISTNQSKPKKAKNAELVRGKHVTTSIFQKHIVHFSIRGQ
jgi:hypothetical protein